MRSMFGQSIKHKTVARQTQDSSTAIHGEAAATSRGGVDLRKEFS
jgi:hypothetical protein